MNDHDHVSVRHGDGSCTCGACKQRVRLEGPSALGYAAAVAGALMCVAGFPMLAVLPPVNMTLVPPMFFVVATLVGYAGGDLGADRKCPACRRYLVFARG